MTRVIIAFLACLLLASCASTAPRSDILVTDSASSGPLPNGFATYTLLLFPGYQTQLQYNAQELREVTTTFVTFGKTIGAKNCAAYFLNADHKTHSVERAQFIVSRLNANKATPMRLEYRDSPILVISTFNPEAAITPGAKAKAISFNGAKPAVVARILSLVSQQLKEGVDFNRDGYLDFAQLIVSINNALERSPFAGQYKLIDLVF